MLVLMFHSELLYHKIVVEITETFLLIPQPGLLPKKYQAHGL